MSIEDKQRNTSDFKRLYRGCYEYVANGEVYSEEKFEIFKEKKTFENHYESEIMTRIATGEILKINCSVVINKEWIPQTVNILRQVGTNFVKERFTYDARRNSLRYNYESPHTKNSETIITPPKFSIQTPSAAASGTFISTKKIDQTAENFYYFFESPNSAVYKGKISNKNIVLKRAKLGELTNVSLGNSTVSATEYIIYNEVVDNDHKPESIRMFLSKHLNVPYKIVMDENNYIQIKYLNDFSDSDITDGTDFI